MSQSIEIQFQKGVRTPFRFTQVKLDPKMVPIELLPAIQFAEKWGIADDFEREEAILNANRDELNSIAHSFDGIAETTLINWLT
jgi:hypothetical protein